MLALVLWAVVAVVLIAVVVPPGRGRAPLDERALAGFADRMGLPLLFELRGPIGERIARRERRIASSGWIGLALGLVLGAVIAIGGDEGGIAGPTVLLMAALSLATGAIGAARSAAPLIAEAPPAVRALEVEPDELSTQAESTGAWATIGVVLIAPAVAWIAAEALPGGGDAARPTAIMALIAAGAGLVAWAILRAAETAIAHRPYSARDDVELAWEDALRAMEIRRLREIIAVIAVLPAAGLAAVVVALVPIAAGLVGGEFNAAFWTLVWAGAIAVVCALGPAAFVIAGRRNANPSLRHWRGTDFGSLA